MVKGIKNRKNIKIVKVPKSMRPTQEGIEETGRQISAQIRKNNSMRYRSMVNASERTVCK